MGNTLAAILAELGGIGGLTASGLLLLAVFLIMRGDLVPRKIHEEVKKDRDDWRVAASRNKDLAEVQSEQLKELVKAQETVVAIAEALQAESERESA